MGMGPSVKYVGIIKSTQTTKYPNLFVQLVHKIHVDSYADLYQNMPDHVVAPPVATQNMFHCFICS